MPVIPVLRRMRQKIATKYWGNCGDGKWGFINYFNLINGKKAIIISCDIQLWEKLYII